MFWSGFSIFALEVLVVIAYLLYQLNWDWLTGDLIIKVIVGLTFILFNIFALIIMIVGLFSDNGKDTLKEKELRLEQYKKILSRHVRLKGGKKKRK